MGVGDDFDVPIDHAAVDAVFVVSLRGVGHIFEDPTGSLLLVVGLGEVDGVGGVFDLADADFVNVLLLSICAYVSTELGIVGEATVAVFSIVVEGVELGFGAS